MSIKISKQRAHDVAKKMSNAAIQPKIKELKTELEAIFEPHILKQIPPDIIELYAKYPKWFRTSSTYRPVVNGVGEFGVSVSKEYPSVGEYGKPIEVSKDIYKKMIKICREIENLRSKEDELKRNIEATLNQLSTFKSINKNFSEAMPFIPDEWMSDSVTSIAVPIENLRKELSQYNSK